MAKARVQDLVDRGWRAAQFGGPADFEQPGGYLQRALDTAAIWAAHEIGQGVYDTLAGYALAATINAELAHAEADLWRRRLAFMDSSATIGHQEGPAALMRQMQVQLIGARECAVYWIGEAQRATGGTANVPGTGTAFGHIETGRYPPVSRSKLN